MIDWSEVMGGILVGVILALAPKIRDWLRARGAREALGFISVALVYAMAIWAVFAVLSGRDSGLGRIILYNTIQGDLRGMRIDALEGKEVDEARREELKRQANELVTDTLLRR